MYRTKTHKNKKIYISYLNKKISIKILDITKDNILLLEGKTKKLLCLGDKTSFVFEGETIDYHISSIYRQTIGLSISAPKNFVITK